jgi:cytochrome c553
MKKLTVKITVSALVFIVLIVVALIFYVKVMLPNVGEAPDMKVELTPERIERGEYLANHVMSCIDCHSRRDFSVFAAPMVPGTKGQGGEVFDQVMGFPGRFVSPNITPSKLSTWTDGEIFRAITSGVSKDGRALFPLMPHPHYGEVDVEDIKSVIAYLRSLAPIENTPEASSPDFPMSIIINTIPKKANPSKKPDESDQINYGKYLVNAAACVDCHTRQEKGKFVGDPFGGGMEFGFPDGSVLRSANITPSQSGIGYWTEKDFIDRFRTFSDSAFEQIKVAPGEFQTLMPWTFYAGMKTEDLKAIFAYLQTLEPSENEIVLFTPAEK